MISDSKLFQLSLSRLSVSGLKKLGKLYGRTIDSKETKKQCIDALDASLRKATKIDAMKKFLLAGRVSVACVKHEGDIELSDIPATFRRASETPNVCYVGTHGGLYRGLTHIAWAVLSGDTNYIDAGLSIQSDDEASLVHTFYEPSTKILQIRANSPIARRIKKRWAAIHSLDPRNELLDFGIDTLDDAEKFCEVLGASVIKCRGERFSGEGFLEVSGKKHPGVQTLVGTADYDDFKQSSDMTVLDIDFVRNGERIVVGFGLKTRSIVFRTLASETSMRLVYRRLKQFIGV